MNHFEKQLIKNIKELVTTYPDYRYKPEKDYCQYTTGQDGRGCLIGQALMLTQPELSHELEIIDGMAKPFGVSNLIEALNLPIAADTRTWLSLLQMYQDFGTAWGGAWLAADNLRPKGWWERLKRWVKRAG